MEADKSLVSGSMALLVLKLLEDGDKYGYQMTSELRQRSEDVFHLKAGTLYPLLHSLEEKGLVNDQPGQGRLDIFTTGSTEEYTMKAAKVGLDPVTSVQFYPPMKL